MKIDITQLCVATLIAMFVLGCAIVLAATLIRKAQHEKSLRYTKWEQSEENDDEEKQ
jgi:hypothetical protein